MEEKNVTLLAADVSVRLAAAKHDLAQQMRRLGMTPANGWRVTEELRHTIHGTEWTFRPVHLREPTPDLSVRVAIDHDGRPVE